MSEQISWALSVQVVGGLKISESATLSVEAYDKIRVAIPDGAGQGGEDPVEVEVQPGGAGQVRFLLIRCDDYGDASHSITYKVNAADTEESMKLDGPHVLIGAGAVGLLHTQPQKLFLSSSLAAEASVQILVGRDATPEPLEP